jgi:hypothetical protein
MPFTPGFDKPEALDMLALCANVESEATPPIPNPPPGWQMLFMSPELGPFQNKWQLWKQAASGRYAVALRGTIMSAGSIVEDLISVMVKATGTLQLGAASASYDFSGDPEAGVHLGFAIGTLLLLKEPKDGILARLPTLGVAPASDVYITGHSQGAAMATLLRSYFNYAADAPKGCSYKTYAFAQPKPGNDHYAEDFEAKFCATDMAFRVTNSLDWVPQVPFTIEFISDMNEPNPVSILAPSFTLLAIKELIDRIRSLVADASLSRQRAHAVALAQAVSPAAAAAGPMALMAMGLQAPVMASLNFVNAGTEAALTGAPCIGPQCQDAFFEHHASTYYTLLQAQQPVV